MQTKIICLIFIFWSLICKHDILRALGDGGGEEDFRDLEGTHRNSLSKWVTNATALTLSDKKLGNPCD